MSARNSCYRNFPARPRCRLPLPQRQTPSRLPLLQTSFQILIEPSNIMIFQHSVCEMHMFWDLACAKTLNFYCTPLPFPGLPNVDMTCASPPCFKYTLNHYSVHAHLLSSLLLLQYFHIKLPDLSPSFVLMLLDPVILRLLDPLKVVGNEN